MATKKTAKLDRSARHKWHKDYPAVLCRQRYTEDHGDIRVETSTDVDEPYAVGVGPTLAEAVAAWRSDMASEYQRRWSI